MWVSVGWWDGSMRDSNEQEGESENDVYRNGGAFNKEIKCFNVSADGGKSLRIILKMLCVSQLNFSSPLPPRTFLLCRSTGSGNREDGKSIAKSNVMFNQEKSMRRGTKLNTPSLLRPHSRCSASNFSGASQGK